MTLERWDPFRELRRMEETVDRRWRGFGPRAGGPTGDVYAWGIPLDVVREGDDVVVHASLPGVKPGDVNVTIEENVLTISGTSDSETETSEASYLLRERRTGSFRRTLRLPDSVDADGATSAYEAGVLTITLPKSEQAKAKRLTIEVKDTKQLEGAGTGAN
ncbi:MAG: Hsp20/alpha crystallin family protein [Dehalococcoidia bacterium]